MESDRVESCRKVSETTGFDGIRQDFHNIFYIYICIYDLFRYVPTFDFDATINLNKENSLFIEINTY